MKNKPVDCCSSHLILISSQVYLSKGNNCRKTVQTPSQWWDLPLVQASQPWPLQLQGPAQHPPLSPPMSLGSNCNIIWREALVRQVKIQPLSRHVRVLLATAPTEASSPPALIKNNRKSWTNWWTICLLECQPVLTSLSYKWYTFLFCLPHLPPTCQRPGFQIPEDVDSFCNWHFKSLLNYTH